MKGAVTAAQLIGLDMAGIDMKLRGRGVNGDDFSIIEVNSSPGLNMHGADNPNISFNLIQTLVNYITT